METKGKIILVIEDDLPLQSAYKASLTKSGYEVVFAANGNEGFRKAQAENPKLIILDLMLPGGKNGFDVLEQLKSNDELAKVPIFVLTNLDNEEKTAIEIGATKYFVKTSISIDDVIKEVDKILGE